MDVARNRLDYDRYAIGYDRLCELSPAYQELRLLLNQHLQMFPLLPGANVCELGAGTGNFSLEVARSYPEAKYTHVDMSAEMNELARRKYDAAGLDYTLVEGLVQNTSFPEESFDLVVIVNALNTCPPQFQVLQNVQSWIKSGGKLFLIDFGREQKTWDWTVYLSRSVFESQGVLGLARELWRNREAIYQNKQASIDQKDGNMWLHSKEELAATVEKVGLDVIRSEECYRGYSDLVVAEKPLQTSG